MHRCSATNKCKQSVRGSERLSKRDASSAKKSSVICNLQKLGGPRAVFNSLSEYFWAGYVRQPRNIFLHGHVNHVRIGDFGLACKDIIVEDDEQELSATPCNGSIHTTGVGTFVYAAPEQLEGSHYDSKSDMFSVGVIAVELFTPFGTEMERVHRLGELRQGLVPDSLSQHWPALAQYVQLLTSRDPAQRPSATQLLESELFSSKDKVIHSLLKKIDEQEEELNKLRRQISQLQSSQDAQEAEPSPCSPPS